MGVALKKNQCKLEVVVDRWDLKRLNDSRCPTRHRESVYLFLFFHWKLRHLDLTLKVKKKKRIDESQ